MLTDILLDLAALISLALFTAALLAWAEILSAII